MTEPRELEALRTENARLAGQLAEARQALGAFARGEVDAVATESSATPVLLHAAQEGLRRSEQLMRALVEKSTEGIALTARDGSTRYLTPSLWRMLGFAPDELSADALGARILEEDRARHARALERLVRTGERDLFLELRARHRDGSIRWIETSETNLLDDPDVGAIVGNYRDVTERRHAEDALRESRDRLEGAQATARLGSWSAPVGPGAEIEWSKECYRILGVPEATPLTLETFLARVHPDDRARVLRASRAATERGAPYDLEHRVERPDGAVRWVHDLAVIERDADGRPTRLTGTVQDVTERHVAGAALRASEERYRRIVENTSEGVWTCDAAGITTFMNARMGEMLGCTVGEALGRPLLAFVEPSDRAAFQAALERPRSDGARRSDAHFRRRDGAELWASIQANPLRDAEGRLDGVLALFDDVSVERRGDEARAHLAAIVESSEDAIVSTTLDGAIATWNRSAEKLHRLSAAEALGTSMFALIPADLVADERRVFARAAAGEAVRHHDTRRLCSDGGEIEVALTIFPTRDAAGAVLGVSTIVRDLTERRQAEAALRRTEEQFRQAQKMEAVGRLAGGVAHDFNNLLSVILSYSSLAIDALKAGDPLRADLEEIQAAGQRATSLTRQLLAFSRQQILAPRVVALNRILEGMEGMLRRLLGEDVHVALQPAADLGNVRADPGQLEQVVMNFAVNARDAMPDGGTLTIETTNVELDEAYAGAHADVAPGRYVMLAVGDTGVGMDAATRARIFEPFFTTKEHGKGTGLGLATVFGIVQQSGGHVGVESAPGAGSTFKVYLPRTDEAVESPRCADARGERRGEETILLVEDEDQVRAVACSILRRSGYHVLEASNGGEALRLSEEFPGAIHLLLTDVVMPRMNGRRLAEQVAALRPSVKVLFASGYTDDAILHLGVLEAGVAFLQKPFTPRALLSRVREALDAPEDRRPDEGWAARDGPPAP